MYEKDEFNQSDSQQSIIELPQHPKIYINVLKHIPAARRIMEGHNHAYEIYSPRCLFTEELQKTNKYFMPKLDDASKLIGNRLLSIEDALFEHGKMKEKIKDIYHKNQKECRNTLWDLYNDKELYYSRFQPTFKKNNFANIFMNIAGINLDNTRARNNFPQIRNKCIGSFQTKNNNNNGSLIFDSHFQSGNLLYAYRNNDERNAIETYDLILQNDVNTRGHNQWFYFKVTNTRKNQKIKINIVNLVKKQSLFSYGLKILTFSEKNAKNGLLWVRNGQKICYQQSNIRRQHKNEPFHCLSFQYEFRQPYDSVYFAPSYPYTYSQMINFMDGLLNEKKYANFLSIKKLCETAAKNTINVITISTGKQSVRDSKIIWILARQHPGQTTSSFMMEGMVKYLLDLMVRESGSNYSFYDNYIFKIIPMVNPDGVIHGNSRAELTGIDSNRVWKKTSKSMTPSVHHIKKYILKNKEQTCLVLDLHSHSKKLGCFFYGNYEQSDLRSYRMLPSLVCQNDIRFCYKNCRFRGGNQNSARKALFAELNIPNIYTVECSLLGYIKDNRINQYKITDYHQMGVKIIDTFFSIQKQKQLKMFPEIKEYPNEGNDFCDAQSARSDSCVSDEQYEEVYNFAKLKKKPKTISKKSKPRSNTLIYIHKHQISQLKKKDNFSMKIAEQIKSVGNDMTINPDDEPYKLDKLTTMNIKQNDESLKLIKQSSDSLRQEGKRQFSIKLRSNKLAFKNIRTIKDGRKTYEQIKEQRSVEERDNKTFGQKCIQVEQLRQSNQNIVAEGPMKTEKKLMIVGSSVEQEKIFVGKNEVGIQMDNHSKQNLNMLDDKSKNKTASNKLNFKVVRRITEQTEHQRGERSFKEKTGVLMFRN